MVVTWGDYCFCFGFDLKEAQTKKNSKRTNKQINKTISIRICDLVTCIVRARVHTQSIFVQKQ